MPNCCGKIKTNNQTIGATNTRPSRRSSTPPCPGIMLLESFTPNNLLIFDSRKSLICSINESKALMTTKKKMLPLNIKPEITPMQQLAKTPPANPAQVLLGLMLGAIFGPPKYLPAKKAKISVAQMILNIQKTIEEPDAEEEPSDILQETIC